eukprot:1136922-Pelagomonas_calceolata.AAC.1
MCGVAVPSGLVMLDAVAAAEEVLPSPDWPHVCLVHVWLPQHSTMQCCAVLRTTMTQGALALDALQLTHTHMQAEAALQAGQVSAADAAAVRERTFHLAQTGATRVALPFGVTILAGAWKDEWLACVAQKMQEASGLGCGPDGHLRAGLNCAWALSKCGVFAWVCVCERTHTPGVWLMRGRSHFFHGSSLRAVWSRPLLMEEDPDRKRERGSVKPSAFGPGFFCHLSCTIGACNTSPTLGT